MVPLHIAQYQTSLGWGAAASLSLFAWQCANYASWSNLDQRVTHIRDPAYYLAHAHTQKPATLST
jgi:hypothetical protein